MTSLSTHSGLVCILRSWLRSVPRFVHLRQAVFCIFSALRTACPSGQAVSPEALVLRRVFFERRSAFNAEAHKLADFKVVGALAGGGGLAVDGHAGADDEVALADGDDGALDPAGPAHDGVDESAAGGADVDAFGAGVDGACDCFAGLGGDAPGGFEVGLVVGVVEADDREGGFGGGGVHDLDECATGEFRIDLVCRCGVEHGRG